MKKVKQIPSEENAIERKKSKDGKRDKNKRRVSSSRKQINQNGRLQPNGGEEENNRSHGDAKNKKEVFEIFLYLIEDDCEIGSWLEREREY